MGQFFEELKRRNVVRVGVAYLVMNWTIMQIVEVIAPTLELPDWFAKSILVFLMVGFPLALFLSWAFEMTPDGVKKTAKVDADESITPSTGKSSIILRPLRWSLPWASLPGTSSEPGLFRRASLAKKAQQRWRWREKIAPLRSCLS